MKKALAWVLVLAMTAAIAVGGTLAYLTDTDEDVNVMTMGKVKIDQLEYERVDVETKDDGATVQEFHDNKPLYPGVYGDGFDFGTKDSYVGWDQIGKDGYTSGIWDPDKINNEVDKMVFVKNKGSYDAYVRSVFAFEAGKYTTLDEFRAKVHLNLNDTDWIWDWDPTPVTIGESTYFVATATYNKVLEPGKLTEISLSQIALDKTATNEDVEAFGETYQVLVKTQGIQADGFEDPVVALSEGFGNEVPFENDDPIKGIDLRTALHYYEGDTTNQITDKVTNVVYALNKEYPDIVDGYDGTLVDVEQDVPVHAYYVPNGTNYDVYFLADNTIYSPKDSSTLYKNMRALQTVDTHNYDVSRVETMHEMFRYCHSLNEIDVSHWKVGNVIDMYSTFDECKSLTELDVSEWDTHNAGTMAFMFFGCAALPTLDVSRWDVSNVTTMRGMFRDCNVLSSLDVGDWNTGKVEDMAFMFRACFELEWIDVGDWDTGSVIVFNSMFSDSKSNRGRMKINNLDFSKWDMSSATNISYMFYGCGQMTDLDLSTWDVSKLETMNHTFSDCFKMENYNFSGWNTVSLTSMNAVFNSNKALKRVDVSDFDTQNVFDFCQVFDGCTSLEEIVGLDQWDTSSGDRFVEFLLNTKVREIDLSSFDTSNVKYVQHMFHVNSELTTIYVGDKWTLDPSQLDTTSDLAGYAGVNDMITNCPKLTGGNGTTPASLGNSSSSAMYARVDTEETPGLLTHINDRPVDEPTT